MGLTLIYLLLGVLSVALLFETSLVIYLLIEVKAMQRSTHRIAYVNPLTGESLENSFQQDLTEDQKDQLSKDTFENIM